MEKFYIFIDGVNGTEIIGSLQGGFELVDFNLTIERSTDLGSIPGGPRTTAPQLSPLDITANLGAALSDAYGALLSGDLLNSVRVVGVTGDGDITYDLKIGDVLVTSVTDADADAKNISFSYGGIMLETTERRLDGSLGETQSFSYDLRSGGSAFVPDPVTDIGNLGTPEGVEYYLTINGVTGPSLRESQLGSFELQDFLLSLETILIPASGSGAGDAKTSLSPLEVTTDLGSAIAEILALTATGESISSVSIEGVLNNGSRTDQVVYELLLGDVFVTSVTDEDGQNTVTLDYVELSLTTRGIAMNGTLRDGSTVTYNRATGTSDVSIDAPIADDSGDVSTDGLTYFLIVDGLNGGVTLDGAVGGFELADFSQEVSNSFNVASGSGGGGAGKANFEPIELAVALGAAWASFANAGATGEILGNVQIVGLNTDGLGQSGDVLYDLRLENAVVAKVNQSDGGIANLELNFEKVQLETFGQDDTGATVPDGTFAFNVAENTAVAKIDPAVPDAAPTLAATPDRYVLRIEGVDGLTREFGGFEVDAFEVEIENNVPFGTTSGGAGAGTSVFSPLSVSFSAGPQIAALQALTLGQAQTVQILGLAGETRVLDLRLGDAVISSIKNESDQYTSVTFDYGAIVVETVALDARGQVTAQTEFQYNTATKETKATVDDFDISVGAGNDAVVTYFLQIDGVTGSSAVTGFEGAFELDGFSNTISSPSGKPTFSTFSLDLDIADALPALMDLTATGDITLARIVGVSASGDVVYDQRLGDAVVSSVREGLDKDQIEVAFRQFDLETFARSQTGVFRQVEAFNWDLRSNEAGPELDVPTVGNVAGQTLQAQNFVLLVDGIANDAGAAAVPGGFNIVGYEFDTKNSFDLGGSSSGGGGAGKVSFGALSLSFETNSAAAEFAALTTTSQAISSVQILGLTAAQDASRAATVMDLRFEDVLVTEIQEGSNPNTLQVIFREIEVRTQRFDDTGKEVGAPQAFTWDVSLNTVGDGVPVPVPGGSNRPPTAIDDAFSLNEDQSTTRNVLLNDIDPDGTTLTASLISGPANGTLDFNANGVFTYTPDLNFNGTDSFTYRASDGELADIGSVSLTVRAVNDAPTAADDVFSLAEDASTAGNVLSNDTDPEDTALTASLIKGPANGTLDLNADGSFTYTPDANFNGADSFTYAASDGLLEDEGTVSLTVNPVNDAPMAVADAFTLDEDGSAEGNVLSNDVDPEGTSLAASLIKGPTNGTLEFNPDGSFIYTPNENFNGPDSFTYAADDGLLSDIGQVSLTINPTNDAPVISGDTSGTVAEDLILEVLGDLSITDADPGESSFIAQTIQGDFGTLEITTSGEWSYQLSNASTAVQTLSSGETGTDVLSVFSADGTATEIQIDVKGQDETGGRVNIVDGTSESEVFPVSRFADVINAGGGDDIVSGGNGSDVVFGGSGADVVSGDNGEDILNGGLGDDVITGGNGADSIDGGAGADTLTGGNGIDTLTGGEDADVFVFDTGKGLDIVTDFELGVDVIGLVQLDPDDVKIKQTSEGALLSSSGHKMLLEDILAADLTNDDFVLI